MSWNYRIVRYKGGTGYGLHEVYYDKAGNASGMTIEPAAFTCDADEGPDGVVKSIERALRSAKERKVLDEPETWPGDPPVEDTP